MQSAGELTGKISAKSQGKSNIQLFTTLPFTGRAQRRQALVVMQRRISASPVTCWIAQCISGCSNCYLLLLLPPSSSGARLKYEVTISRTNTRVMRSATAPLPGRLMASRHVCPRIGALQLVHVDLCAAAHKCCDAALCQLLALSRA